MALPVAEDVPAEIRAMLGPPALLPSEDAAIYEATLAHFARQIAPQDLITWMLVKDLADHRLEIARYRRIRAALVCHPFDQRADTMVATARAEYASALSVIEDIADELHAEVDEEDGLDVAQERARIAADAAERRNEADQSLQAALAEIPSGPPTDRHFAGDLPHWIGGYQQLDRCLQAAEQRFIATLRDIERHVGGFGKSLRRIAVIEGEVLAVEEAV